VHSGQRILLRSALLASATALAVFAGNVQAQTYDFQVVHSFSGPPDDGRIPTMGVQFDNAGNLYGTTSMRDRNSGHGGVVFKIAEDGSETIVHVFSNSVNAIYNPPYEFTVDRETGDLFGTTTYGGGSNRRCAGGCGVLYKLAADGTFTVLHAFKGTQDGAYPAGSLIRDSQGNLYGTVGSGAAYGKGAIYEYRADGTFAVLHDFRLIRNATSASGPGGVIRDSGGNLYGVLHGGGASGFGSVYKLATDGTFTTLHSFAEILEPDPDGYWPVGALTRDEDGNLYGVTTQVWGENGDNPTGTVFKLAPDGTLTTLYTFTGAADGAEPNGSLLRIDGNLYGTTSDGGAGNPDCDPVGCGVAFKVAPDGTYTVLHTFLPRDGGGATPLAGFTSMHDKLYGTASDGGGRNRGGTVYSIDIANP
jgi:uncharacterized repeat protein (TIGR03803 family)